MAARAKSDAKALPSMLTCAMEQDESASIGASGATTDNVLVSELHILEIVKNEIKSLVIVELSQELVNVSMDDQAILAVQEATSRQWLVKKKLALDMSNMKTKHNSQLSVTRIPTMEVSRKVYLS